ncbi:MAG: acyl-CoA/acyl-ACP dehydrogenase [Phenylobacterium sp.]|uniref:acyl-CoA dehydrogenase family protein n=1 Tax=Phenylobacterium sp. TaxID=1871053 RepID=UPI0025EBAF2D|nr:acyl-CoA dehydrogenase family protein [Phenylobacterium sp.]MCA3745413.1 acyl-CoA/acyl-ACP dehydrogenase [Phenylobacterium sp.]MCA3751729.1 acyl-CoA/acyl-ACP dehydrogenase [Phenylobacterium sp.]MCA6243210.1 acyl-CoA/acyl-ACP dehydrogenase [Phenylobacterium sp.]MCA6271114.1 acyl-CoA/acyl-ACP dehydrogenase [Phenylobacterium sp.]MCA6278442.1 acyl-CoA/acyl-ACP dehydrogenase [Phenylobacterium sp.]
MKDLGRIGFSEDQASLLEVATDFCQRRSPVATVRRLMEDEAGHDPAVWTELGDLGWLGVAIPEAYGGSGLGLAEVVPLVEQMGRRLMAGPFVSTTLVAQGLIAGGTEDQKREVLPRIAAGEAAALALAELDTDWEADSIACTATRQADGRLALSGLKVLVTDANAARRILASVRLDGAPALVLLTPEDLPAGALRRETVIDETRRSFALTLDGVVLEADQLLDPGRARAALEHLHLVANLLAAADMVGGTQACIDYTLDYLRTRTQFGKVIGSYQALKHPIVEAYTRYEQARSHLYSAAHCFNEQGTGEIAVRMAKAAADVAFSFAADRSIQFHGGFGFTWDCDAQLYRRRAIWHAAQFGDAAFHRKKLARLLF